MYTAARMIALLTVRARIECRFDLQAPPQDRLVRLVPVLPSVRALRRFPTYSPLAFDRLPRAE